MGMTVEFLQTPEFEREFKKLSSKYQNLDQDFEGFRKALSSYLPELMRGVVRISNLGHKIKYPFFKAKHFRSSACRGKGVMSGFRIIYTFDQNRKTIVFIEMYHKNKKKECDISRIKKYGKKDLF